MMDHNFDSRLNIYLRSEKAILEIYLRNKFRQAFYMAIAFIVLLTALIMLDIGVFYALMDYVSTKATAFMLAGSNMLLFMLLMCCAARKRYQHELKALEDIRDYAKAEVTEELQEAKNEALEVAHSVKNVTHNVSSVLSGDAFGLAGLIPIISKLLKSK